MLNNCTHCYAPLNDDTAIPAIEGTFCSEDCVENYLELIGVWYEQESVAEEEEHMPFNELYMELGGE